ncbi:HpcH/HpaI aldolase/citrate lyase family protein [Deinococcus ruber]|uniref:CoA ester lyase n=1 Tax=Deinococcus ruber TaxID=1848197 RepID=A0A918CHG8_9DEIO|nr:CoA ester lyase [Deinococcus ruber]GGR21664.1 CoA ester lyase [Deinococcus ruber]
MTAAFRSVLYVPADKSRALAKLPELRCDAVILDLEDAVLPEQKGEARAGAARALRAGATMPLLLRLNGPGTPWEQDDLELALRFAPAGIVLPKAEEPARVREVSLGLPLWLMIETPLGVQRVAELARVPGVAGLIVGANDLLLGLRGRSTPGREALLYALGAVITAARVQGITALDAVHNDLQDAEGLEHTSQQGRDLGFDGRTLIHPAQIETVNRVYGVSEAEAQQARELLAGWEEARQQGRGVAVHRGRMIEELHAREARNVLERWKAQK